MGGWVQAALSLTLALGLHVGAFALRPDPSGAAEAAAGEGGADLISLAAQNGALADLVAAWDTPPDVAAAPESMAPPQPDINPPPIALAEAPLPPDLPLPLSMPQPDAVVVQAPPPPPSLEPEPEPISKPKAKPKPDAAKKAVQPEKAPSGQSGQTAEGTGGGTAAGKAGKTEATGLTKAQTSELKASWGAKIRSRIERRKTYPNAAKGASGTVTVRLTVTQAGGLAGLAVKASSGNAALDAAAIKAVKSAGKFPAAPKGLAEASYSFTLNMTFTQ